MKAPPHPDPRFLTLFVDASFCHRTHAAGYGAWAKKATFEKGLIFGGPLPRGIRNAGEAELGGIALALRFLLEKVAQDSPPEPFAALVSRKCHRNRAITISF